MATTTEVNVIEIQTGQSVKSVASLKQEIKDLKSQLLNLDKGTEQYNETLLKLGNATHELKAIQEQTNATNNDFGTMVGNTTKAIAGMAGAVSAVTGTLSLLGVQIGDDSKLMKTLVSAMAVTQGVAAIESGVKAVKALGISIKTATTAQKTFNSTALKNPYILMGAAVLATITAIIAKIKSQEKAEAEQHAKRIEELNKQLELQRKITTNAATTQAELAKYANEATRMTEREIADEKERLKAVKEANQAAYDSIKKETDAAKEEMDVQKKHVDGIKQANVQNEAAIAILNNKTNTYYDLVKKQNEYTNAINDANKKLKILNNTQGVAEKKANANAEATKGEYTEYERMTNAIELANAAGEEEAVILQRKIQLENAHLNELTEGTREYDKQAIKIAGLNKEYADYIENVKKENHEKKVANIEKEKNAKLYDAELKRLQGENMNISLKSGSAVTDPTTFSGIDENTESKKALLESEYQTQMEYITARFNANVDAANAEMQLETTTAERKYELMQEVELMTAEHNVRLNELNIEKNEKDIENDKAANEAKKALMQQHINFAVTMANQLSSTISAIADAQEEGTKEQKNLQVASTIISTLAGAAGGFAQAVASYPPPYGPILGAVTMAATLATGFAQVAKIKNTKVSKTASASTPSTATVQSINNTPTNVRQTSPMWSDETYIGEGVADTQTKTETTVTLVYSDVQTMAAETAQMNTNNTI